MGGRGRSSLRAPAVRSPAAQQRCGHLRLACHTENVTRVGGSFQGVSERFYVSLCFSGRIRPGAKEGVTRIPESSYYPHQPWASVASKRQHAKRGGGVGLATRGVVPPAGGVASGRGGVNAALRSSSPWPGSFNPARGVSAGRARGRPHRRVDPTPRSQLRGWGQRRRARGRPHRRVDPTPRSQLYRLGSTRGRRSQPRVPALVKVRGRVYRSLACEATRRANRVNIGFLISWKSADSLYIYITW